MNKIDGILSGMNDCLEALQVSGKRNCTIVVALSNSLAELRQILKEEENEASEHEV